MLADDLNIAGALAVVFEFIANPPSDRDEAIATLQAFDHVLGVLPFTNENAPGTSQDTGGIAEKCKALDTARATKDFATADALRNELQAAGYEVKTTNAGTVATQKLA